MKNEGLRKSHFYGLLTELQINSFEIQLKLFSLSPLCHRGKLNIVENRHEY